MSSSSPDCLFEGASFSDLMAHVARRHPTATPEDFVPGLIHHRPLAIPLSPSQLPFLPRTATIHPEDSTPSVMIGPYPIAPSERFKRLVARGCFSGRRPRKEHFEDRRGAAAAIAAVIENSRRLAAKPEDHGESLGLPGEGGMRVEAEIPMTARTTRTDVTLVDVLRSAATAREDARFEIEAEVKHEDDCVSPGTKNGSGVRVKGGSTSSVVDVNGESVPALGESPSIITRTSLENEIHSTVREVEEVVKRSERLRKKAQTYLALERTGKEE